MMFNGLLMCGDSDTSDFTKESGGASFPDTECSSWDADARAHYYHNKLMSTLQVLANREETVRVQAESLRVAEARIAALSARADKLRAQLDHKANEQSVFQRVSTDKIERADAAVAADAQEVEEQKDMVKTLQTNLSVIEDLYRECFYETAKQEELIDMLRKSYLDVRLTEKRKSEQIGKLQHVISSQQWSLERCQDMSMEVENLKMEISNFLNSSNNDSGMWSRGEDSLPGDVLQDLHHITDQLLQLRTLLAGGCTCGLEEENMRLKDVNDKMQIQVGELRDRVCELESALSERENGDHSYRDKLADKEKELAAVKQQLAALQESVGDRSAACEALATQLRQAQVSIEDQTRSLSEARQRCALHEASLARLREQLDDANRSIEESRALREEVSSLKQLATHSGRRVRALQDELARAQQHCRSLDGCYRDKAACAAALQAQLEEAHGRGAALCDEVKRVVSGVHTAVRRMRARHREQENKIKEQETLIKALQFKRTDERLHEITAANDKCSKCVSLRPKRSRGRVSEATSCEFVADEHNRDIEHAELIGIRGACRTNSRSEIACECPSREEQRQVRRKPSASEMGSFVRSSREESRQDHASTSRNETASCECSGVGERQSDRSKTSGSEVASCSSAPTPPRRLLKKKFSPSQDEKSWWCGVRRRDAGVQRPARRDATCACDERARYRVEHVRVTRLPREASPSAELEQRVSALHAALQRSQERWAHARST
ncbi:hypothetical protein ABMA28_013206 [Loxostege sticticalis]|uniref:Uncharacterized protein n=1 Tax=Loxostege sticticalis TaxID=481309 RepID=A0ABD0THH4_LOXSC